MTRGPLVVAGDALLDVDLTGSASRLSPDAPVPVIDDAVELARPGGAALAASLLARDGEEVVLVTALGGDQNSARLRDVLDPRVGVVPMALHGELARKVRVRAGGQSVARLDYGHGEAVPNTTESPALRDAFDNAAAILVCDYGHGNTTALRALLADFAGRVPLVWDPHPNGVTPVPHATAVTPNVAEARQFAKNTASTSTGLRAVSECARVLVEKWQSRCACVTLGAGGALVSFGDDSPLVIPAPPVRCVDQCGAGDRFAATFAAALARGALLSEAAQAAVCSAAAFVAQGVGDFFSQERAKEPGLSPQQDVLARIRAAHELGQTVVATGGCFDLLHAGHVEVLRAARSLGDFLVVCLNSDESVARLKGPGRPIVPAADRRRILEALECVDAVVIFGESTPARALELIRPNVWAKGGDYDGRTLPEAATLAQWGGQAVILPYVKGKSTTALVAAAGKKATRREGARQ